MIFDDYTKDTQYRFFEDWMDFWFPNYRRAVLEAKYENNEAWLLSIKDNIMKNWNMDFEMKKYILEKLGISYLLQVDSKENMFKRNEKLIYLVLKRKGVLHREEELYDIGLIGLTNAINTFDSSKGIKESTYFYKCISNEISKFIYLQNTSKRRCPTSIISLDYEMGEGEGSSYANLVPDPNVDIEHEIIEKTENEILYSAIQQLKPSYQEIIKKYFGIGTAPRNTTQLSKELGISREAINQKRHRALKQLQKILEKENFVK